ncbi:MAG: HAMP domain-containing sensor histidine kinase [Byssovorax sp.]
MRYPAFLAEVALPQNRKNLRFSIATGYGTALVFGLLGLGARAFGLFPFLWPLYSLVAFKVVANTLSYLSLRYDVLVLEMAGLNVAADLLAMTGAVYFTGGPESPLFAIYGIEISIVALLTNRGTTVLVGTSAIALYGAMVMLVRSQLIPALPTPATTVGGITSGYVVIQLLLVSVVLGVPTLYTAAILKALRDKEHALEERNHELVEASKHKSQFMANVTHELRTPIHGICGLSDLVSAGIYGPVTEKQKDAQQKIKRSAQSLLGLIDDLLQLARSDAGKITFTISKVDLGELLPSVVANVRWMQGTKRQQRIELDLEAGLFPIFTDRGKLTQILINLLANAVKFTPDGGAITLRARLHGDASVALSVEDNGVGIPAAELGKIFEAFHQVDATAEREFGGAGLGLSLVQKLVEVIHGEIRVESVEGEGSTFTVTLPRSQREAVAKAVGLGVE